VDVPRAQAHSSDTRDEEQTPGGSSCLHSRSPHRSLVTCGEVRQLPTSVAGSRWPCRSELVPHSGRPNGKALRRAVEPRDPPHGRGGQGRC
jgi:hypothetical protein